MLLTALLGGLIGLVLAFTGAGGGVLSMPLLVLVLHRPLQEAAPVGLLAVGLAAAFGAAVAWRQGMLRYKAAALIGVAGMLTAPLGVWLAHSLPSTPLLMGTSVLLAWLARQAWQDAQAPHGQATTPTPVPCEVRAPGQPIKWTAPCARALAATGLRSGLLSGLVGVGGGFVIVPALQRHTDLDLRSVQATSLAVIALVSLSGVTTAMGHGSLSAELAAPFVGGAVVAMLIGQRWAGRVHARRLKQVFALVCGATSVMLLARLAGWL